jgi:uncharacterized RDD family membrane protein YckC
MAAVDWDHYEVACFSGPTPSPKPTTHVARGAPLADRGARLAAWLIDLVLCLAICAPGYYLLLVSDHPGHRALARGLLVLGALGLAAVQGSLLTWKDQTIGKKAVGVRIVRFTDGDNPCFFRAVLIRSVLPGLIASLPFLGKLFALIDVLNILGEERRCLHDYLAGTKVVDV